MFRSALAIGGLLTAAVLILTPWLHAADPQIFLVAPTEPLTPQEQLKLFHLPPGFAIQLVASEPEIRKPINMSFDAQGRLFVTQSIEYPFPAKDGTPRDTIKLLTDANGDGVLEKVSTFADELNIPIGVLPLTDAVLGYSIPSIYRFIDADGDGRADRRDVAYATFGFRDTHGMASSFNWWLDGWVYACHGFSNQSTVQGADGQPITMQSGNTYRLRPDGTHIEYYTHGQVNPFGMAFDTLGNVYTADCHSKPIYMLLRGAYYPSFGKPDDGLGYGPDMIAHSHGSTGICGVTFYGADQFPAAYRDTVFIGNPVTGRVNHDQLEPHGSTLRAVEQPDFVTCDDPWFRPVDLKLAPDGSLYIADFYNRIIGHYEVPLTHPQRDRERGRIWRVVYTGAGGGEGRPSVNQATASLDLLCKQLGSPNIVIRTQAVHQLVHRIGKDAVPPVRRLIEAADSQPLQRAHALWVLERLSALDAGLINRLARDTDRLVRVHLTKALAGRNDWKTAATPVQPLVAGLLKDEDAFVRRAAADALGLHAQQENVEQLLQLWAATPGDDTHLIHTVRMALRDNLQSLGKIAEVAGNLPPQPAYGQRIAEICLGIPTPGAAEYLQAHITQAGFDRGRLPAFVQHTVLWLPPEQLKSIEPHIGKLLDGSDEGQITPLLRAAHRGYQSRGVPVGETLRSCEIAHAAKLLQSQDEGTLRAGIELAREFQAKDSVPALTALAQDVNRPGLHQPALESLVALDTAKGLPLLSRFVADAGEPLPARQKGADLLAAVNSAESRAELLRLLQTVPDQVALAIARGLSNNPLGGEGLLTAVTEGKASARLLQDAVVDGRLRGQNLPDLAERLEKLLKDLPPEDERMKQLLTARLEGFRKGQPDLARGAEVYTKICANCHRIRDKGAKVGPDLDGVGLRGIERLLEDTLNPNRNVDQAFRSSTIVLKDGKIVTGLVAREEGEVLIVINDQGKELRVPMGEIDERKLMKLSPMPANIAEQLPEADYFHLIGYLMSQREAPSPSPKAVTNPMP